MPTALSAENPNQETFDRQVRHHCRNLSLIETPTDCFMYWVWLRNGMVTDKASVHTLHRISDLPEPGTWEEFRSQALRRWLQLVRVDAATSQVRE